MYLHVFLYARNISSSLDVFGNLWQSAEIFRKCLEMIVWPLDVTFGESLEIF